VGIGVGAWIGEADSLLGLLWGSNRSGGDWVDMIVDSRWPLTSVACICKGTAAASSLPPQCNRPVVFQLASQRMVNHEALRVSQPGGISVEKLLAILVPIFPSRHYGEQLLT
jgi:hypothetical protein